MNHTHHHVAVASLILTAGCYASVVPERHGAKSDGSVAFDAGVHDDGGLADAGRDAGFADAGRDAGRIDAGRDAGSTDAGSDAGLRDAGAVDASLASPGQSVAFQIDRAHTGSQPTATFVPPLVRRWTKDFGGSVSYPLIADGRVFVTASRPSGYGTDLYALDLATGNLLWGPLDLGGTYGWSGTAFDGGRVFAVNFDGLLRSFDAATGAAGFTVQLPGQYAFSGPPTAGGGSVYVAGAGVAGTLYAVDEATGSVRFTRLVMNGDDSAPALTDLGVFVTYACNMDYAFGFDGTPLWQYAGPCEGGGGRTPVVFGGSVYSRDFATSNLVLDARTGAATGAFSADAPPAFAGSVGYFRAGSTLTARSLPSLTALWTFTGDGALITSPIVANGHVYVGSSKGALFAVDAQSGALIWSDDLGSAFQASDTSSVGAPTAGFAASATALVVPAGRRLAAYW